MKDPVRLLAGAGSDAERALLRAGAGEEPPADGAQRLAAVLGIAGAGAGASAGAGAGASAGAGADGSAGAGVSGATVSKVALKWVLLVPVGLAVVAAAVVVMRGGAGGTGAKESGATSRVGQSAPAAEAPREAPAVQRPAAPERAAPSIAREIEQLDAARNHLSHGDARGALAELDAYAREHAAGALRQEATLLRIEALVQSGDREAARRIAAQFLRDHPQSPHAARVRALASSAADAR